jgi:hypothetical protein
MGADEVEICEGEVEDESAKESSSLERGEECKVGDAEVSV